MLLSIMSLLSLCFSLSTTALTVDNVVRELKDITWDILCGDDRTYGVLDLPDSQRHKIEDKYATENQCRNAAVHFWLFSDPYASWRKLIRQLDCLRQHTLAERIRDYAEKLSGMLVSCLCCHWQLCNSSYCDWVEWCYKCLHEVHVKVLSIHVYELCSHACNQSPTWNETRWIAHTRSHHLTILLLCLHIITFSVISLHILNPSSGGFDIQHSP